MLQSKFISDVLEVLLDDDDHPLLRLQIPYLEEREYEYTGAGVIITFGYTEGIQAYKLDVDKLILNGPNIESDELQYGAYVILFITNGLIETLEIVEHGGEYPKKDLDNYVLKQEWVGSKGRRFQSGQGNAGGVG